MRNHQFIIKEKVIYNSEIQNTPLKGQFLKFKEKTYIVSDVHLGELNLELHDSDTFLGPVSVFLTEVVGDYGLHIP